MTTLDHPSTREPLTFTFGDGTTLTSEFTHDEALAIVADIVAGKAGAAVLPARRDFAASLYQQWKRFGKLSPKQMPWVHRIAHEAIQAVQCPTLAPIAKAAQSTWVAFFHLHNTSEPCPRKTSRSPTL